MPQIAPLQNRRRPTGEIVADGGRQRKVASGFIDILGRDRDGALVVIEVKAGRTRPEAVAQVLGYMADVAAEDGGRVRGYLIGADHHDRVIAAARAVPDLELRRYSYRFSFTE
jgi:RecB family endonuclease NucS